MKKRGGNSKTNTLGTRASSHPPSFGLTFLAVQPFDSVGYISTLVAIKSRLHI
jgi:hypothetical protein